MTNAQPATSDSSINTPVVKKERPKIVGPDTQPEFMIKIDGTVVRGFGRGGKQLGIPTANLDQKTVDTRLTPLLKNGIYYGWASLFGTNNNNEVYPMVMSVGWNPFYKNEKRSVEVHLICESVLPDFYGAHLKVLVLGWIRPELDYSTVQALIDDINFDIKVALNSLDRQPYQMLKMDTFLTNP